MNPPVPHPVPGNAPTPSEAAATIVAHLPRLADHSAGNRKARPELPGKPPPTRQ